MSTEINTRGMVRSKVASFPAGNETECLTKSEITSTGKALVNGSYGDNECPVIDDIQPARRDNVIRPWIDRDMYIKAVAQYAPESNLSVEIDCEYIDEQNNEASWTYYGVINKGQTESSMERMPNSSPESGGAIAVRVFPSFDNIYRYIASIETIWD